MITLELIADYLKQQLQDKLIAQDHVASGKLLESIEVVVDKSKETWRIVGSSFYYGEDLDTGTPPGRWLDLKVIIDWMISKRIAPTSKKARVNAAFAIRNSIYQKGTPTDGDPNKLRWISGTLEEEEGNVFELMEQAIASEISVIFDNMIEKTQKEISR